MSLKGRLIGIVGFIIGAMLINLALKTNDVLMGMVGLLILLLGFGKIRYG